MGFLNPFPNPKLDFYFLSGSAVILSIRHVRLICVIYPSPILALITAWIYPTLSAAHFVSTLILIADVPIVVSWPLLYRISVWWPLAATGHRLRHSVDSPSDTQWLLPVSASCPAADWLTAVFHIPVGIVANRVLKARLSRWPVLSVNFSYWWKTTVICVRMQLV